MGAASWAGLAARPGGGAVEPPARPRVRARVLGVAQDGGLPHLGCRRSCCVAARRDPSRARRVASLGVSVTPSGPVLLVDATPDLRSQIEDLRAAAGVEPAAGRPVDGILLTHAHTGHYAGLIQLGREAMGATQVPVLATTRMCAFLRANKPWSRLVEWGHVRLDPLEPGTRRSLAPDLTVEVLAVPHRDEDSDTVAYLFTGPSRRLLYVPDTDAWEKWTRPIATVVSEVDVALLDGTFFGAEEVAGRDLAEIPHPTIPRTMELLAEQAASGRCLILFTHLNHTNPALDGSSDASRAIIQRGFRVAGEGMEFAL